MSIFNRTLSIKPKTRHFAALASTAALLCAIGFADSAEASTITVKPSKPVKNIMVRMPRGVNRGCLWVDGINSWGGSWLNMRRSQPLEWTNLRTTVRTFSTLTFHFSATCEWKPNGVIVRVPNDNNDNVWVDLAPLGYYEPRGR